MKLVKHIDFTKEKALDPDIFTIAVGDKWPNKELQSYTDKLKNLFFTEEGLNLRATYEKGTFESARIHTKGKFFFKYGRIDITARLPKGKGTWPALWMMSNDGRYGHWPRSGEIDIMEHVGNELDKLYLCVHTESYNHTKDSEYFNKIHIPGVSDSFNTFSLVWTEDKIEYLLNGEGVVTYEKGEDGKDTSPKGWPFDHPFFLIMNLAVGGMLGGQVDKTAFPQTFTIKDIKVYQ
jgi:beta-glucanase (GH16 family)